MEDEATLCEFFTYLANFDISDYRTQRPPMTALKREMINVQLPHMIDFMKDVCENNTESEYKEETDDLVERCGAFYNTYKHWCDVNGFMGKFILKMKDFKTTLKETFKVGNKQERIDGERPRCYRVSRVALLEIFKEKYKDEETTYDVIEKW